MEAAQEAAQPRRPPNPRRPNAAERGGCASAPERRNKICFVRSMGKGKRKGKASRQTPGGPLATSSAADGAASTKPTEVRLSEVLDMYTSLRGAGLLDDHDLEAFRAACQAYVRAGQSSSGRATVRSAGGRVLEYDLRRKTGQETFAVLRAHPE